MTLKSILTATLISMCLAACSDSNDEPEKPSNPNPVQPAPTDPPEEDTVVTTIAITSETLEIPVGSSTPVRYTVDPDTTTVRWESSDTRIARVDANGIVTGVARGSVTVTARAASATASVAVKVVRAPHIGDYFYSDGTFSSSIDNNKSIIGIIFWIGDPTADDAALRREHPECSHGLVVAAYPDMTPTPWQSNASMFGSTTGSWIESNLSGLYVSPVSIWGSDTRRNLISGYNNTCALKRFNADASNSAWPVEAVARVQQFSDNVQTPASTSGWFLPGTKELSLLINSEHDGDVLDFNDIAADKCGQNKTVVNKSLEALDGAQTIGSDRWAYDLWSSNEWDIAQTYFISSLDGTIMCAPKNGVNNQLVRCILAF